MKTFTIGFTQKSASAFFQLLKNSDANHLIDVRLNNDSQLAGFSKKNDLKFFLKEIINWEYIHLPELAPTKEILNQYKKHNKSWEVYEIEFLNLMERRSIEKSIDPNSISKGCLLCSEHLPHNCHRRLVLEYLNEKWNSNFDIIHLY